MKPKVTLLPDRTVLRIYGSDAEAFLQNIITNHIDSSDKGVFSALLSPQGKVIFDFFVFHEKHGFLIDIALHHKDDFIKKLTFYKLRAEVSIEDLSDRYDVIAIFGDVIHPPSHDDIISFIDPRFSDMGYRCLMKKDDETSLMDDNAIEKVSFEEYTAHRVFFGIPEGGQDYHYGNNFPHDACFDLLNGIHFQKGCYVGQEVVSRMQHRGTARKRIVILEAETKLPETGDDIFADDQKIGQLGTVSGQRGLGLVRLDRLEEAHKTGKKIHISGVTVFVIFPSWANYK